MKSSELVQVFRNTMEIISTNPELKKATEEACRNTAFYEEGFFSSKVQKSDRSSKLSVIASTSFRCAQSFAGSGKTTVLNFANPFEPGGGAMRGAKAQEEDLCRCSNLYSSLTTPSAIQRYYLPNAAQ